MWLVKGGGNSFNGGGGGGGGGGGDFKRRGMSGNSVVAVAIDNDKGSRHAIKWAIENLLSRGQTVVLIHVVHKPLPSASTANYGSVLDMQQIDKQVQDLFISFHCFCTRKEIKCLDIRLEDTDIAKAIAEYVSYAAIEYLVLGASSRHGFIRRFKVTDIPATVTKSIPDFCTVYVISKGKISSAKKSLRPAPFTSPLQEKLQDLSKDQDALPTPRSTLGFNRSFYVKDLTPRKPQPQPRNMPMPMPTPTPMPMSDDYESPYSQSHQGRGWNPKMFGDLSEMETDISFVSSGRPSSDLMSNAMLYDGFDSGRTSCVSTSTDRSYGSPHFGGRAYETSPIHDFSMSSFESGRTSCSSSHDDSDAEMRRLKLELQKTMDLYSTACKEALTAKQKAEELQRWRVEEERRIEEEARQAEKEKARLRAGLESPEATLRVAELEAQRRVSAEMKAIKETESQENKSLTYRYRRYLIEEIEEATNYFSESRKIGEGGYGPVFKCKLDHTPVAVKVLRPDAAQGRSQFQQEVEVLSCMRHPNMVLLLGACPEYGCLVYEYMASGSLDDRLFRRGNTPPLPWQLRFKIAAEIATGILFLHQTKPEPIVHRDLKPGNILLDRNFVSKVSDVGLARLLPSSAAEDCTQYRMTSTAGTFCYIDPEYQQTGMLGVKSDVYSLGIMLLQIITGKPPMGLTHTVRKAIEQGTLSEILDPSVPDWPMEEALCFAKLALQCSELRRKDRPDLGKVVLPELNRLRELAEDNMIPFMMVAHSAHSSVNSLDGKSETSVVNSEHNSSKAPSSSSSFTDKPSGPSD